MVPDPIHSHFTASVEVHDGKQRRKTTCKHCAWTNYGAERERWYKHIMRNCPNVTETIRDSCKRRYQEIYTKKRALKFSALAGEDLEYALTLMPPKGGAATAEVRSEASGSGTQLPLPAPAQRGRPRGSTRRADRCDDADKAALDLAYARMMHETGLPLMLVDNPLWIRFVSLLRPAYTLPSRRELELLVRRCADQEEVEQLAAVTSQPH